MPVLIPAVTFFIGLVIAWILLSIVNRKRHDALQKELQEQLTQKAIANAELGKSREALNQLQQDLASLRTELQANLSERSRLQTELHFNKEKLETQKQEIENIGERFETQFKVL